MPNTRHSYVEFYPSDWMGGVGLMPRVYRSVYFDICLRIWDTAEPVPAPVVAMMVADLPNGLEIVDQLVAMRKVMRGEDGSLSNARALAQAEKAKAAWEAASEKGQKGAAGRWRSGDAMPQAMPEALPQAMQNQEPEPELIEDKPLSTTTRARRLPADWHPRRPYPVNVQTLVDLWPPGREDRELDGFRDYWTSRKRDAAKLDWDKTWHNRIRDQHDRIIREARFAAGQNGRSPSGHAAENAIFAARRKLGVDG